MYATCETEGCSNAWAPIPVTGEWSVVCGVCGNPITNITDIKPTEGKELPPWISEMLTQPNSNE